MRVGRGVGQSNPRTYQASIFGKVTIGGTA
jgi:hypothetical protein